MYLVNVCSQQFTREAVHGLVTENRLAAQAGLGCHP